MPSFCVAIPAAKMRARVTATRTGGTSPPASRNFPISARTSGRPANQKRPISAASPAICAADATVNSPADVKAATEASNNQPMTSLPAAAEMAMTPVGVRVI